MYSIESFMDNYILINKCDVFTQPYPNFNGGLDEPLLKLQHG